MSVTSTISEGDEACSQNLSKGLLIQEKIVIYFAPKSDLASRFFFRFILLPSKSPQSLFLFDFACFTILVVAGSSQLSNSAVLRSKPLYAFFIYCSPRKKLSDRVAITERSNRACRKSQTGTDQSEPSLRQAWKQSSTVWLRVSVRFPT